MDSFATSYGDPQPVAVTARRDLRNLAMKYSINGGRTYTVPVREWRGGERYGDEADIYYAEFRGVVRGADPGDNVKVWFTGNRPGKGKRTSESFTYRLAEDTRNTALVVANEDYEGVNPEPTRRPEPVRSTPTRTSRRWRRPATRRRSGTCRPKACRTTSAC